MAISRRGALKDTLAGIYALLNVAAMTAVTPGGLHQSQAPEGTVTNCVVIQGPTSEAWDAMTSAGEAIAFTLAAVTFGADAGPAMAILQIGQQLLQGARPTINANHVCIQCRWVSSTVFPDPALVNNKPVWRAVGQFALLVDQIS